MCCVFFPFILDIKFVGRTSRGHTGGRSHRISHPPSFWGVGVMCGWCLAYCTGVVLNTVGESAMPDSKENKQADAGSRRFRRHLLCGALLCNFLSTEHEGLSTHVQRKWSAEPFMPSILSLNLLYSSIILCFLPIHSGHVIRKTSDYYLRCAKRKILEDGGSALPRGATFFYTPELKLIHLSD